MSPLPLAGIRVLDLSRVLAGPWCTQCLADLGADVLKVENPDGGDETRGWQPPAMGGQAAYYSCANRNKRSLAVDLKTQEGQQLIRRLAAKADVLVENYKLGTLERFGLGPEALAALNPRLVYCSISGYGRTGPEAERAGYDFVIQAESGLMSITGEPDGAPMKVGVAVSDLFAGLYASQAILAALVQRQANGRGQHIDVPMFDSQLAALANVAANALATGRPPARYGNAHANIVPYETFDSATGPFVLAVGNDRQFRRIAPDLADDPRFATNAARVANRAALRPLLEERFRTRPREKWLEQLRQDGIPAGPIRRVDEALASDQARAHELVVDLGGGVRLVRYPVRMGGGTAAPSLPPCLGEGGEEAVREWLS